MISWTHGPSCIELLPSLPPDHVRFAAEVTIGDSGEEFFHILGDEVMSPGHGHGCHHTRSHYSSGVPIIHHYSGPWIVMVYPEKLWCFKQTRFAGTSFRQHIFVDQRAVNHEQWPKSLFGGLFSRILYIYPLNMWMHHLGTMLRCRLTNLRFCYFWLVRTLVRSTILLFLAARGRWGGRPS